MESILTFERVKIISKQISANYSCDIWKFLFMWLKREKNIFFYMHLSTWQTPCEKWNMLNMWIFHFLYWIFYVHIVDEYYKGNFARINALCKIKGWKFYLQVLIFFFYLKSVNKNYKGVRHLVYSSSVPSPVSFFWYFFIISNKDWKFNFCNITKNSHPLLLKSQLL